jgi:hypothetical protein
MRIFPKLLHDIKSWFYLLRLYKRLQYLKRVYVLHMLHINKTIFFWTLLLITCMFLQLVGLHYRMGHSVAQWLRHCATNRKVAGSIPDGVIGILHWQSFRPHYGPGVDSASNRNQYQEYFLTVKAAGAESWQPCHLHVPIVLKSGNLSFLEPSGPVKACNGIALPLPCTLSNKCTSCSFVYT